jgi:iron-sulfur cluster assembly protein
MGTIDDGRNRQTATQYVYLIREKIMGTIPASVTDTAKNRILAMAAKTEGAIGITLSIAQGKGCGGNEYRWGGFVTEAPAGHEAIVVNDAFAIYVPMIDSFNMFGMTIDFGADEKEQKVASESFKFINPNVASTCGCGASVTFKEQPKAP